jgi:hypothetical protein
MRLANSEHNLRVVSMETDFLAYLRRNESNRGLFAILRSIVRATDRRTEISTDTVDRRHFFHENQTKTRRARDGATLTLEKALTFFEDHVGRSRNVVQCSFTSTCGSIWYLLRCAMRNVRRSSVETTPCLLEGARCHFLLLRTTSFYLHLHL